VDVRENESDRNQKPTAHLFDSFELQRCNLKTEIPVSKEAVVIPGAIAHFTYQESTRQGILKKACVGVAGETDPQCL
jgi:hypothetical protein